LAGRKSSPPVPLPSSVSIIIFLIPCPLSAKSLASDDLVFSVPLRKTKTEMTEIVREKYFTIKKGQVFNPREPAYGVFPVGTGTCQSSFQKKFQR
jgi:hypothetical protein